MPPKRERVRGETLGSLYRALCSEADGRRKDVRRERLLIMEQLGYLKRKNRAEPASTLHLGKFARGRPKALPKPPADGAKEARERAENRRKLLYAEGVSSALKKIQQLQIREKPVPQKLWKELQQAQSNKFLLPILPDPGPGQYKLDKDRHKALKGTMGSPPKKLSSLISPPRAPPHSYLSIETKRAYGGFSLVGKDKKVGERNKKPKPKKLSYIRQVNAGLDGFVEPDEDPDAWKKLEYWFPPKKDPDQFKDRQLIHPADAPTPRNDLPRKYAATVVNDRGDGTYDVHYEGEDDNVMDETFTGEPSTVRVSGKTLGVSLSKYEDDDDSTYNTEVAERIERGDLREGDVVDATEPPYANRIRFLTKTSQPIPTPWDEDAESLPDSQASSPHEVEVPPERRSRQSSLDGDLPSPPSSRPSSRISSRTVSRPTSRGSQSSRGSERARKARLAKTPASVPTAFRPFRRKPKDRKKVDVDLIRSFL